MSIANPDIRPVVYSLCEQRRLPILVTDLIADYLDEQDLLPISKVSRALNHQANPLIYHNIVLDLDKPEISGRKALLLLRTLLTNRAAANNIRSLALTGDPLEEWREEARYHEMVHIRPIEEPFRGQIPPTRLFDLSDFEPKEIELYKNQTKPIAVKESFSDTQIPLSLMCASIVWLATYLQDLHIDSDYFRYPDFRQNMRACFESKRLQNLRSTNFSLDVADAKDAKGRHIHITAVRDWHDTLLLPFLVPAIESISTVMTLSTGKLSQLRVSSLARLVLHHCQVEDYNLNALLAATPQLRYLEYHVSIDCQWSYKIGEDDLSHRDNLGLNALFGALHHVSDSLRELHTSVEIQEDGFGPQESSARGCLPSFRQHTELSELKHLHTLTMPWTWLLGWEADLVKAREWDRILPASLRQVTFTDDLMDILGSRAWTDKTLVPIFTNLLEWMANRTHGSLTLKFGLVLRNRECEPEFNESERLTLSSLCEEHGILCSIEKQVDDVFAGSIQDEFTCILEINGNGRRSSDVDRQIELNRLRLSHIR